MISWVRGVCLSQETLPKTAKIKSSGLERGRCGLALNGLVEGGGARGTRTLTALRPGDFKSPMSTISSSPLGWLPCCVALT